MCQRLLAVLQNPYAGLKIVEMSYILEALKKSEKERQKSRGPRVQTIHDDVPPVATSQHSLLLFFICTLALAIILLSVYFLFFSRSTPATTSELASNVEEVAASESALEEKQVVDVSVEKNSINPEKNKEKVVVSSRIYEIWELPDPIKTKLPALTFSFHVYSKDSEKRTIIINNTRYRQGSTVVDNVTLFEITERGVVLEKAGYRYFVPVLLDW